MSENDSADEPLTDEDVEAAAKEFDELIASSEEHRRTADDLENRKQRIIRLITERYNPQIEKERTAARNDLLKAHRKFPKYRSRLFVRGTKEARFSSGVIKEYNGPQKLITDLTDDEILEQLRSVRIKGKRVTERFIIRPKPTVNRKELLKAPEVVAKLTGVRIGHGVFRRIIPAKLQSEKVLRDQPYTEPISEDTED